MLYSAKSLNLYMGNPTSLTYQDSFYDLPNVGFGSRHQLSRGNICSFLAHVFKHILSTTDFEVGRWAIHDEMGFLFRFRVAELTTELSIFLLCSDL